MAVLPRPALSYRRAQHLGYRHFRHTAKQGSPAARCPSPTRWELVRAIGANLPTARLSISPHNDRRTHPTPEPFLCRVHADHLTFHLARVPRASTSPPVIFLTSTPPSRTPALLTQILFGCVHPRLVTALIRPHDPCHGAVSEPATGGTVSLMGCLDPVRRADSCHAPNRKQWRRDHPFGFYAKPARTKEGVLDLKNWECGIPGKEKTMWEGGLFKLTIAFPDGEPGSHRRILIPGLLTSPIQNTLRSLPNVRPRPCPQG